MTYLPLEWALTIRMREKRLSESSGDEASEEETILSPPRKEAGVSYCRINHMEEKYRASPGQQTVLTTTHMVVCVKL